MAYINSSDSHSKIISRSAITSFLVGLGAIAGLCLQILQARIFGPEIVGLISLAISITTSLSVFILLGFDKYIVREIPKSNQTSGLINTIFKIIIGPLCCCCVLLVSFSGHLGNFFNDVRFTPVIKVFSLFLFFFSCNSLFKNIMIGAGNSIPNAFIESIAIRLLRIALVSSLFFFFKIKSFLALSAIYLITELLSFSVRFTFLKKKRILFNIVSPENSMPPIFRIIRGAFPFLVVGGTYLLVTQLDKIFIGRMLHSYDLGIYSIAASISGMLALFSSGFIAFWPEISRLFHEERITQLAEMYRQGVQTLLNVVTPFLAWTIMFAPEILSIFGQEFIVGKYVLIVLLFGKFVDVATGPIGAILLMTRYAWIDVCNGLISLSVCIALNLMLIPHFGIIGAAIASAVCIALVNIIKTIEVYYFLGFWGFRIKDLLLMTPFLIAPFLSTLFAFNSVILQMILTLSLTLFFSYISYKFLGILSPTLEKWIFSLLNIKIRPWR